MFNCKKTSELISKNKDQALNFVERLSLKVHLFICKPCELFELESDTITKCIKYNEKDVPEINTTKKEAIEKLVESESKK